MAGYDIPPSPPNNLLVSVIRRAVERYNHNLRTKRNTMRRDKRRLWQAKITEDLLGNFSKYDLLRLMVILPFFLEMVEDWTVNYKPDLLTFVPYEWSFNIILRDFEMVWLGNQHNWIESTSNKQENGALDLRVF